ncbi:MAG TPA: hypothetical protein VFF19_35495 [Reyranella sp.]|nr:hypothetical protein [Reyranella sp.]
MSKSIAFLSLERRIDALFARHTKPGSPGAVVAVAQGGEVEICRATGWPVSSTACRSRRRRAFASPR